MALLDALNKSLKGEGRLYWFLREWFTVVYSSVARLFDTPVPARRKRILFYHINSLGYAGTEKFLQILARHLNKKKYSVYYMYPDSVLASDKERARLTYLLEGGVVPIPFDFRKVESNPPHFVSGMNPDIQRIMRGLGIDLLVTADSGSANYPFSVVRSIPIILLNIFGQPNVQKNVSYHCCISQEVADGLVPTVPPEKIVVLPVPSERPVISFEDAGLLRKRFGIKDTDIVFGRIGRPDDGIYDPIGIKAFQRIVAKHPEAHYLIMAPMPVLERFVEDQDIPNVHFLPPSAEDRSVWAFHAAIDVLAHFRNDGESFGLNIVESMLAGKPVVTHRSHIWNAHLEYLDESFARIADKDNVTQYAEFLEEMILLHKNGALLPLQERAREKAESSFLIETLIPVFEDLVEHSITKRHKLLPHD